MCFGRNLHFKSEESRTGVGPAAASLLPGTSWCIIAPKTTCKVWPTGVEQTREPEVGRVFNHI
jgi:hypothetical protein